MTKKLPLLILFFILSFLSFAQQLRVLDESTNQAIEGANLISKNSEDILKTDADGTVSITKSLQADGVIIDHPSYKSILLSGISSDTVVYLTEEIIEIDEVVISANKWEQDKAEVPNEILTISPKQIATQKQKI